MSIIGIAKNAGKTTVMNKLIEEYKEFPICITSIGLDGEKLDNITQQEKPRIIAYPGMYIITAEQCLKQSTAKYHIHEKTAIRTALGNVLIVEIVEPGLVLVAGPASKKQMKTAIESMKKYKPYKILIDGALFRKSIASREVSDGIILVTGASYSSDINKVVNSTKNIIDQLSKTSEKLPCKLTENQMKSTIIYSETNNSFVEIEDKLINNEEKLLQFLENHVSHVYFSGALTDRMVFLLLKHKVKVNNITLIVQDSSYLLISDSNYENLLKIGVKISVLNPIEILFVAYNPTSPYNYDFDDSEFRLLLSRETGIKPINVLLDLR